MNQYFYVGNDGTQKGPVSAESLIANGVTGETLVWRNGLSGWIKAAELNELAPLFAAPQVPPIPVMQQDQAYSNTNVPQTCPDNYLTWAILTTILCCWPFSIPAIINATKVEKLWYQGDRQGAVEKSKNAKKWCWVSFVAAIVVWILYYILVVAIMSSKSVMLNDSLYY